MSNSSRFLQAASTLATITCFVFGSTSQAASEFEYFGSEIDYWQAHPTPPQQTTIPPKAPSSAVKPTQASNVRSDDKSEPFSWPKYLDPKNKEFFREGDYLPPEPFMEIVRNPTDANLQMWFKYIEQKNELSARLQTRMKEYLSKNGNALETPGREYLQTAASALPKVRPDAKRYLFRMYFDSHCPHCKRMFTTLQELQNMGFSVEAKQVDSDPRGLEGIPIRSERATALELREKGIQSVPLLLVGDLQKKNVYRLSGYQSVTSIFQALQQGGAMN